MTNNRRNAGDEAVGEIIDELGRWPAGYTIGGIVALHAQVCGLLARNRDHVSRRWDVRLAALARIVLSERAQARRVDDYNHRQRMKQR